ncbi:MAG TPA: 4-hydroxy-tetrahydrodipicolinate reductase [Clostridiales bacterium]|nr:4-hydroxy-tetrahydrodipicolinate reductase [Clostridiales bacterium]
MRILLSGYLGEMGRHVISCAKDNQKIVAGVSLGVTGNEAVPCFESFDEVNVDCDIIIDFSHHSVTIPLLNYAIKKNIPVVLATTGQTDEEKQAIKDAAEKIPVFYAANYSVGIAVLIKLAKQAAAAFPDADIEIVEAHHNRKIDAPSGTALAIGNAILEVRPDAKFDLGRAGNRKREKNDIGINSIRMGNVVGIHEVYISTNSQTLTLKHEAHSRALFADGALAAADFLLGKPAGLYGMEDMLK